MNRLIIICSVILVSSPLLFLEVQATDEIKQQKRSFVRRRLGHPYEQRKLQEDKNDEEGDIIETAQYGNEGQGIVAKVTSSSSSSSSHLDNKRGKNYNTEVWTGETIQTAQFVDVGSTNTNNNELQQNGFEEDSVEGQFMNQFEDEYYYDDSSGDEGEDGDEYYYSYYYDGEDKEGDKSYYDTYNSGGDR